MSSGPGPGGTLKTSVFDPVFPSYGPLTGYKVRPEYVYYQLARVKAKIKQLARSGPPGSQGFRLDAGDCDALHFFYDGTSVQWWRR